MGLFRPEGFPTRWPQAARAEGWLAHRWSRSGWPRGTSGSAASSPTGSGRSWPRDPAGSAVADPLPAAGLPRHPVPAGPPLLHALAARPLILGMLAAWRYLGEERALELCAAAARAVDYAGCGTVRHPRFGLVREGLRYYVPVEVGGRPVAADAFDADPAVGIHFGDSPLGGAHEFLALPLWLLAREERADGETRRLAGEAADLLVAAHRARPTGRWGKWTFLIPDGP